MEVLIRIIGRLDHEELGSLSAQLTLHGQLQDRQNPDVSADGTVNNDFFSSRFLQNGAYWKIANVELGYNFPAKWFEDAFLSSARVYLSGQNLYTLTAYRGYNIDFAGGVFTPGFNYCSYPAPVTFMLGVNLSF